MEWLYNVLMCVCVIARRRKNVRVLLNELKSVRVARSNFATTKPHFVVNVDVDAVLGDH